MNLLNSVFDTDKEEIRKVNKKNILISSFFVILIIGLLVFVKKNNYYINEFTAVENNYLLFVEKDYVNLIKDNKKIMINDIELEYSINEITPVNDDFMVNIKLNNIVNIKTGKYKILLGKENLFDFIFRIIKK